MSYFLLQPSYNIFLIWLYDIRHKDHSDSEREKEREMFYLTTHSTHFIYSYMASDIWLRTILIVRKDTRCRHIDYSYGLTAGVLLYAPSHRQDSTYHGLCYTSSMGPSHEGSIQWPIAPLPTAREKPHWRHCMGYSFWLAARVLLYAPSHRKDSTYHSLCYVSCGASDSSMGPPWRIDVIKNTIIVRVHCTCSYNNLIKHRNRLVPS